jgi:hypothetical protein
MDSDYRLVIAMAETLVPDVCALIMEFLEDIHIAAGKRLWKEKMRAINEQYKDYMVADERCGYLQMASYSMNGGPYFQWNWREIPLGGDSWSVITNINKGPYRGMGVLPDNY